MRHVVIPRSPGAYVAEQRRRGHFPALVAAVPELRDGFLHRRWFLSPQTARLDLALVGAAAALTGPRLGGWGRRGGRRWSLLAVPYLASLPRQPVAAVVQVAADAVGAAALLRGSLAARTPVL